MIKETNVTQEYLKAANGKFDLDAIFTINLKERNVYKLNAIVKCKNLVYLNLTKNKIANISGIDNLSELKFLNLSFNLISSMDGLEHLTKLRHLRLIGNKIDHNKNFQKFKTLLNLEKLYFQEPSNIETTSNPICKINDYRNEVFKIFVNLKTLDGIKKGLDAILKVNTTDKDETIKLNFDDLNFNFKDKINLDVDSAMDNDLVYSIKSNLDKKYLTFQKEIDAFKQLLK